MRGGDGGRSEHRRGVEAEQEGRGAGSEGKADEGAGGAAAAVPAPHLRGNPASPLWCERPLALT